MKRMKKLIMAVCVCGLTLGMSVTAFAAPSVTHTKVTATDSKGNILDVSETNLTAEQEAEAIKIAQERYGKAPIYMKNLYTAGVSEENPVTIHIPISIVSQGDDIVVLHLMNGEWAEEGNVSAEEGMVNVTVTSCSPFVVIRTATMRDKLPYSPEYYEELKAMHGENTADTAARTRTAADTTVNTTGKADASVSPKTGDEGISGFTAVIILCTAVLVGMEGKRRFNRIRG